jgi:hypothetical protein
MAEQQINIRIKLTDEVTANLNKVGNSVEQLGMKIRLFGRNISQLGSIMSMTGVAITAPLIVAFKKSAEYSVAVNNEVKKLTNTATAFSVSLATALIPTVQELNKNLQGLLALWNNLSPATQQLIVHSIAITGAFLLIGGSITFIIGKLFTFIGNLVQLTGRIMLFIATATGMQVALVVGIGGALVTVIFLMLKFQNVGRAVMNALEIAFKTLSIGFWTVIQALIGTVAFVIGMIEKASALGAKLPEKFGGKLFKDMTKNLDEARTSLDAFNADIEGAKQQLASEVVDVITVGKGQWSDWFEKMKGDINNFFEVFKNGTNKSIQATYKWGATIEDATKQIAQAMTTNLSTFFFDAFTRQLKTAQEYFSNFGKAILQILTQVLAKWVLVKTVGAIFPTLLPFFHQGGVIRAHSGYLAKDEVPIIAQAGEGVLSRKGMSALGGADNLAKLNRGYGISGKGGVNIYVTPIIQLWSASDVERNQGVLVSAVSKAITNNAQIRKIIKEYT